MRRSSWRKNKLLSRSTNFRLNSILTGHRLTTLTHKLGDWKIEHWSKHPYHRNYQANTIKITNPAKWSRKSKPKKRHLNYELDGQLKVGGNR